ncbi:MAG: uroporphyrinogen-III synthase [Taibaiella sp.]|nr:uroporphyrinogen-III synthase [Taibaiella sp.]
MAIKHRILSTASLPQPLIELVELNRLAIDVVPFIKINSLVSKSLSQQVLSLYDHPIRAVFTSAQSVIHLPHAAGIAWDIYCIGNATLDAVNVTFPGAHIAGTADNAKQLAQIIIDDNSDKDILFFCGDIRRDDLPDALTHAGIAVKEIIVYHTELTPQRIQQYYDAVLFFSPSGVQSFFSLNSVPDTTTLFAIGSTTADTIKQYTTANNIITGYKPGKYILINTLLAHFQQQLT